MKQEKGLTLLETICTILLFALLLQSLLNFFGTYYINAKEFEHKAYLADNARSVMDFIQENMRKAEAVKIEVEGDSIPIEALNYVPMTSRVLREGRLSKIYLNNNSTYIALEPISVPTVQQGQYRLVYRTTTSTSNNVITDQISDIRVKKEPNSDEVIFTCTFKNGRTYKIGDTKQLAVTRTFTESLAYKLQIS